MNANRNRQKTPGGSPQSPQQQRRVATLLKTHSLAVLPAAAVVTRQDDARWTSMSTLATSTAAIPRWRTHGSRALFRPWLMTLVPLVPIRVNSPRLSRETLDEAWLPPP